MLKRSIPAGFIEEKGGYSRISAQSSAVLSCTPPRACRPSFLLVYTPCMSDTSMRRAVPVMHRKDYSAQSSAGHAQGGAPLRRVMPSHAQGGAPLRRVSWSMHGGDTCSAQSVLVYARRDTCSAQSGPWCIPSYIPWMPHSMPTSLPTTVPGLHLLHACCSWSYSAVSTLLRVVR